MENVLFCLVQFNQFQFPVPCKKGLVQFRLLYLRTLDRSLLTRYQTETHGHVQQVILHVLPYHNF